MVIIWGRTCNHLYPKPEWGLDGHLLCAVLCIAADDGPAITFHVIDGLELYSGGKTAWRGARWPTWDQIGSKEIDGYNAQWVFRFSGCVCFLLKRRCQIANLSHTTTCLNKLMASGWCRLYVAFRETIERVNLCKNTLYLELLPNSFPFS